MSFWTRLFNQPIPVPNGPNFKLYYHDEVASGRDCESRPSGILTTDENGEFTYKRWNEWQLCPKCNGFGGWHKGTTEPSLEYINCDVGNGKKIISKINGQPPE